MLVSRKPAHATVMGIERILLLERNRLHLRKVTRILICTGAEVVPLQDPSELGKHLDARPALLCADCADLAVVLEVLEKHPHVRATVWSGEQNNELLARAADWERLSNLFGRPAPDAPPRDWELLWVVRRLLNGDSPKLSSLLAWGFTGFKQRIRTPSQRDACVETVVSFCSKLNCPGRVGEMVGELAHELLMNAMYDAPVDQKGRPRYAHDRKAPIKLEDHETAVIRWGSDGARVVVSVTDNFGRLPRAKVFDGMARGLAGGQMDKSHGGAGLGMLYIYKSTSISVFNIEPGKKTEVIGIYELDLNQRTFRTLPRSVHVFVGNRD